MILTWDNEWPNKGCLHLGCKFGFSSTPVSTSMCMLKEKFWSVFLSDLSKIILISLLCLVSTRQHDTFSLTIFYICFLFSNLICLISCQVGGIGRFLLVCWDKNKNSWYNFLGLPFWAFWEYPSYFHCEGFSYLCQWSYIRSTLLRK